MATGRLLIPPRTFEKEIYDYKVVEDPLTVYHIQSLQI
jgi:hypothetical protein